MATLPSTLHCSLQHCTFNPNMLQALNSLTLKNEILSSFPLQMALHFNISLFPFHLIQILLALYFKYDLMTLTFRVILYSAYIVHISSEAIRLGLGFYGNLAENMSALSGFLITSSLIQLPITVFLLASTSYPKLPLEYVFYPIVFGIAALKRTATREMSKYAKIIMEDQSNSRY
ncbi:unnamed protein product [Caenorhabditis bovis]|uniref:Uncharacterized protein n=1 Tax=Caenorhabditis bovis TaxID=2654633 RepID=A0A8S1EMZ9_9PELO|nr:unnamed protein product [Caenorhabditis bovis]